MNSSPQMATDPAKTLNGKIALVTGSTSGIGLGVAIALAKAGAKLVLNGLGAPADIERARGEVETASGVAADYDGANLMNPAETAAMIKRAEAKHGRLDILVNNAGIQHVSPIETFPEEKWDAIIALNLSATFHASKAAFAGMKERKFGRIINVASAHGLVASPFKSAYVAAKHGVVGLTKTIGLEGAEFNVTCNAICPGYVWTPLVERQIDDQAKANNIPRDKVIRDVLLAQQPNKRFATVEEMGAIAVFLAGDLAASITGTTLAADGGWTAH